MLRSYQIHAELFWGLKIYGFSLYENGFVLDFYILFFHPKKHMKYLPKVHNKYLLRKWIIFLRNFLSKFLFY